MDFNDPLDMTNPPSPLSPFSSYQPQDADEPPSQSLLDHTPGTGEKVFAAIVYLVLIAFLVGIFWFLFWLV